jgi:hypothetical protein
MAQQSPPGFGAFAQYRAGLGARALALAGAFTAVAQGPEGIYWNPAGLAWSESAVGGMYTEPFAGSGVEGIKYQFLGATASVDDYGFGIGWMDYSVSGISETGEEGQGGSFDYDSSVYLGGLSVKEPLGDSATLALGATFKLYRERMLEGGGQGTGFDLGLIVDFGSWRVGYCSQDFGGTRYRWHGTGQQPLVEVPWLHRFGVAVSWFDGSLLTSGDVMLEAATPPEFRLGAEWTPVEGLALRGGLRLESLMTGGYELGFAAGFGVAWEWFTLDATYMHTGQINSDTYILSLGVVF